MLKMIMVLVILAVVMFILALRGRLNRPALLIVSVGLLLMISLTGCSGSISPEAVGYTAGYAVGSIQQRAIQSEKNHSRDTSKYTHNEDIAGHTSMKTINSDTSEDAHNEDVGNEDANDEDTHKDTSRDKVKFYLNGSPFNNDTEGWELYNTWPSENHTEEFTSDGWTVIYLFSPGWMEKYGQSTARTCPNVGGYTETTDYDGGVTGDYQPEEPPAYNWKPLSTSERMAMEFGEQ